MARAALALSIFGVVLVLLGSAAIAVGGLMALWAIVLLDADTGRQAVFFVLWGLCAWIVSAIPLTGASQLTSYEDRNARTS